MMNENLRNVLEILNELDVDDTTPKLVRNKLKEVCNFLLDEGQTISIRIDRSLQSLDDINEDVNIPVHIKTQLWDIVSRLESIPQ